MPFFCIHAIASYFKRHNAPRSCIAVFAKNQKEALTGLPFAIVYVLFCSIISGVSPNSSMTNCGICP